MKLTSWLFVGGLLLTAACEVPCATRRGDDPSCNLGKSITELSPTRLSRSGGTLTVKHEDISTAQKISLRLAQGDKNAQLNLPANAVTSGQVTATVTTMDLQGFATGAAQVILGINDREAAVQIYIYATPAFAKDSTIKAISEPTLDSITGLMVIDRQLLVFRKQSDGATGFKGVIWTYPLGSNYELPAGKAWGSLNWDGVAQVKKLGSLFVGTAVNADDRQVRLCTAASETCDDVRVIQSPLKSTLLAAWSFGDARSGLVMTVNSAGGANPIEAFTVSNGKFVDSLTVVNSPTLMAVSAATLTDLGGGPVALLVSSAGISAYTYGKDAKQLVYDSALSMRLNQPLMTGYLSINSFAIGDLDQDKLPDAAVNLAGRPTAVDLLNNRGDGVLTPSNLSNTLTAANVTAAEIGDINGDGVNDVILGGSDKNIAIFRNSPQ